MHLEAELSGRGCATKQKLAPITEGCISLAQWTTLAPAVAVTYFAALTTCCARALVHTLE
jgi:hypothetical protein